MCEGRREAAAHSRHSAWGPPPLLWPSTWMGLPAGGKEGRREGGREPCLPACWLSPLPAGAAAAPPTRRQAERVAESERDLFFPSSTPSSERGPPVRPSVSVPPAPRTGVLVNGGGTKGGSHHLMNTLADGYSRDNFKLNAQERRRQESTHRRRTY